MADVNTRPYSTNYSGLVNQAGYGMLLLSVCWIGYELMRYTRRSKGKGEGKKWNDGLGSVETWEFGYLFQARCWSVRPAPRLPKWPLSWIPQMIMYPEHKLPEMIGLDQTLYLRFIRGCWWFTLLHTFTTLPILLPIHLVFADSTVSSKSLNRASLSALIMQLKGKKLLWVHQIILYWLFVSWVATIWWIARGLFQYRKRLIRMAAERLAAERANPELARAKPLPSAHPHSPHAPDPDPIADRGLRLRTIMVTNVPVSLRSESELRDYFIYHMSKPIYGPALTHGFLPRVVNFILSRKPAAPLTKFMPGRDEFVEGESQAPIIERVVTARKMSELQSQLERREEVLRKLEASHIKLARNVLKAVKEKMENSDKGVPKETKRAPFMRRKEKAKDPEQGKEGEEGEGNGADDEQISNVAKEEQTKVLIEALAPFVKEFMPPKGKPGKLRSDIYTKFLKHKLVSKSQSLDLTTATAEDGVYPPPSSPESKDTIWDVLHSLPRGYLDPYQPLTNVNTLFRGATVPSIDYHTAKLGLLTSLINENRSRPQVDYTPASTAFVTFHNPRDALRAANFLPCHPDNPLACLVEMAPDWRDLDWERVGKSTFTGEFIRDWVVKLGVWGFTLFWVIPVSFFVALVSIDNLGGVIPQLGEYFDHHQYTKEIVTSFLPTVLVTLLAFLVPVLLFLIAKKGHAILTMSRLDDTITSRYYKFLVCNVLVFFCVGTTTLIALLRSFTQHQFVPPLDLIAQSFPAAAPFYVGWLVFQAAMGGLELGLYGLPLLVYPGTKISTTLRRRQVGTRPRLVSYYFWLPNHVLVVTIVVVFAILNPLVIPFAWIFFCVVNAVIKNQMLRVYSKLYDQNGTVLLIRIMRYSLDGFLLSEIVFLALNVILRRSQGDDDLNYVPSIYLANISLTGILLIITVGTKLLLTRHFREKFDYYHLWEADVYYDPRQVAAERGVDPSEAPPPHTGSTENPFPSLGPSQSFGDLHPNGTTHATYSGPDDTVRFWTWRHEGRLSQDNDGFRAMPRQVLRHRASSRAEVPLPRNGDERDAAAMAGRSSEGTLGLLRRWSLAGGLSGGVAFPRELDEVQEKQSSATPTDSEALHSALPLIDMKEREDLRDGNKGRRRGHTIGSGLPSSSSRPHLLSRTTISFEQPLASPRRETKKSVTSSVTSRSASSRSPVLVNRDRGFSASTENLSKARASPINPSAPKMYALVQPRPPTKPWDDVPRHDIPYKNPCYGSKLDGFLWLPRNPLDKLDLDDSVELRRAITTEPGGGGLGEWVDETPLVSNGIVVDGNDSIIAAPGTLVIPGAHVTVEGREAPKRRMSGISTMSGFTHATLSPGSPGRHLTGTEEIVLPPGIKARVLHDEYGFKRLGRKAGRRRDDDSDAEIENATKSEQRDGGYFTVKRKVSERRPGLRDVLRRGKSFQSQTAASISGGIGHSLSTLSRARSMSDRHASTPLLEVEPALLPDLHAQSPFADPDIGIRVVVTRSSLGGSSEMHGTGLSAPIIDGLPSTTGTTEDTGFVLIPSASIRRPVVPLPPPRSGSPPSSRRSSQEQVSFREAVVGEVLAEEHIATTKRVKYELEEAGRAVAAARSVWFGWMWKHVPTGAAARPKVEEADETTRVADAA